MSKLTLEQQIDIYEEGISYLEDYEPEEVAYVLTIRDGIEETVEQKGISSGLKEKLEILDSKFKDKTEVVAKNLGVLLQMNQAAGKSTSHWWWYLDKITKKEKVSL